MGSKSKKNKHTKAKLGLAAIALAGAAVFLTRLAKATDEPKEIDADNKYLEQPAPANQFAFSKKEPSLYEKYGKRIIDKTLSFCGLVLLAPVFAVISVAIEIDDPGPVLFKQKRIGKDKHFFELHKFRSMKMSTPHDVPTHQLEDPDQYITRVGKFLRKTSLDELPQIWDIFRGKMSIIGPRPALWNQEDLVAERDKYGANGVMPGLTGLAQINGRDELEIPAKAQLDGKYVESLREGSLEAFRTDAKCFIGTIRSVVAEEGVVEGGTGEMKKALRPGVPEKDPPFELGCDKHFDIDLSAEKKVLITGAGSYIGGSFKKYAQLHYPNLTIDELDMEDPSWRSADLSKYDSVYHIAGIAHADIGNVSDEIKEKYYAVNTDLAVETAKKAKAEGVKQFIFMSSMIVYGESAPYGKQRIITRDTVPCPANFYGDSKWQADKGIRALQGDGFKVAVLRPPMVYGKGSKGNYPVLASIAKKLPVFPRVQNERSMIYIGNLCEFLCKLVLSGENGIYFPQNPEYTRTSDMVQKIAGVSGKSIVMSKLLKPAVALASHIPGKIGQLADKAFGNNVYSQSLSRYSFDYQIFDLEKSVIITEGADTLAVSDDKDRHHILVVSQYFHPEQFRINDICTEWVKRGYRVTVLTGIPNYPQGEYYEGYSKEKNTHGFWNGIEIIRLPIEARGTGSVGLIKNYLSFVIESRKWVTNTSLKANTVFTYEVSPMTQALAGVWYSRKFKVPHILYVTDLWPENVEIITGINNKAFIGSIQLMVNYIYKHSTWILTSSKSFIPKIEKQGIPSKKIVFWPQYAEDFYKPVEKATVSEIPDDGRFNIVFAGNIGYAQGLGILPKVAVRLKKEERAVRFSIIGDGRFLPELRALAEEYDVTDYFNFIERRPAEDIPQFAAVADALLITLSKSEVFSMTIPAKTQSCMACGRPILVSADGEVQSIIVESGAGLASDAEDEDGLFENIKRMMYMSQKELDKFAENALDYYSRHFDKKKLLDQIDTIIKGE